MPTFIKADRNPAIVTIWSVSQQATFTLSWDTGNNSVNGTVWVNDGVTSQKLNDIHEKPIVGVRGHAATRIGLGKKLTYELRPTNNAAQVLASVSVEGREEIGLPHGVVLETVRRFRDFQGIFNLRVLPGIDSARIMFRTRQPTNPIIDITHPDTGKIVTGAVLGRWSDTHDYTFSLPQGTVCRFRILAYSQLPGSSPVEETGLFLTGSRKATVFFDTILVNADGDPGFYLGAGDLDFHMGAGDIDGGDLLADASYADDISDGGFRQLNMSLPVDHAPLRLWVQVQAFENDRGVMTPFGQDRGLQLEAEGATAWTEAAGEHATLTKWFDLSDAGPTPEEIPFTLATGARHLDFTVQWPAARRGYARRARSRRTSRSRRSRRCAPRAARSWSLPSRSRSPVGRRRPCSWRATATCIARTRASVRPRAGPRRTRNGRGSRAICANR